jgi:hypothetical protein
VELTLLGLSPGGVFGYPYGTKNAASPSVVRANPMGRGIPPAYAFAVLADRVLLSGELRDVFRMLKGSRLRDRISRETPSILAVRFSPESAGHLQSPDVHALLRWLTEHGVAFAEDRNREASVAELGRELQSRGVLPRRITTIEWSSQDEWKIHEHVIRPHPHAVPSPVP